MSQEDPGRFNLPSDCTFDCSRKTTAYLRFIVKGFFTRFLRISSAPLEDRQYRNREGFVHALGCCSRQNIRSSSGQSSSSTKVRVTIA